MRSRVGITGRFIAGLLCCGVLAGCSWLQQMVQQPVAESRRLADMARAAEERGNLEEATTLLTRAVRANSEDGELHRRLARLLAKQGKTEAALEYQSRAVELSPGDPDGWVHLALLRFERAEYALVDRPLQRALSLDPQHSEALRLKGRLAEWRGNDERALQAYHRLLRQNPRNVDALLRIADIHIRAGRPQRAAPLLRTACNCSEADRAKKAEAEWLLGIAYGKEQRWREATEALSTALALREGAAADEWYRLAYACYQAGDRQSARRHLQTALGSDPDHEHAHALAAVLRRPRDNGRGGVLQAGFSRKPAPAPEGW